MSDPRSITAAEFGDIKVSNAISRNSSSSFTPIRRNIESVCCAALGRRDSELWGLLFQSGCVPSADGAPFSTMLTRLLIVRFCCYRQCL